jgi:hypothetical protein
MMTDNNLPWLIFGRKMRPFSLALSLSTGVIGYATLNGVATGVGLDGTQGRVVGVAALLCVGMLVYGWWARSDKAMNNGLLVCAGVWASAGTFLALDIGTFAVSTMMAICWAVAAGGAWLLEVSHR